MSRLVGVGVRTHASHLSRSPMEITVALLLPLIYATIAVYLFRAGDRPEQLLQASVGAGLMGIWSSVLFGSGGAIQNLRWMGILEHLIVVPAPLALVILPLTLATAVVGVYAMAATILWGVVLFDIPLSFADPVGFAVAVPVTVLALGMFGLLLASTFVLMRNANALANTLEYPVWMLSGMLVSTTALPGWTRPISAVLPSTWGADALRAATGGGGTWWPLSVCLGLGAGYFLLGAVALVLVERRARRSATLGFA
jgi:ABC-2 type transport system permease protein